MPDIIIQTIAATGFLISAYAYYVEKRRENSKKYRPLCDISDRASCSKAFSSPYGKFLLLPNSIYGVAFFLVVFILSIFGQLN
jgi:vitamin-K-epoxide reductase (warfarin-sensitive)